MRNFQLSETLSEALLKRGPSFVGQFVGHLSDTVRFNIVKTATYNCPTTVRQLSDGV